MKKKQIEKKILLVITDLVTSCIAGLLAFFLVAGKIATIDKFMLVGCSVYYVIWLALFKLYKIRLENSSMEVLKVTLIATIPAALSALAVIGLSKGFSSVATRWILVYAVFSFIAVLGSRAVYRLTTETGLKNKDLPGAIVYGAGDLGTAMARQCARGRFPYNIKGFIDDNPELEGELVVGYPVIGDIGKLEAAMTRENVDYLIIAITEISSDKIQKAVTAAKHCDVQVKIVPKLFNSQSQNVSVRDIDYADLLGRELITIEKEPLFEMFSSKTILVTGAAGSIGSEICRQLLDYNPQRLILVDIDETELHDLGLRLLNYEHEWSDEIETVVCDIKNGKKLNSIIAKFKPQIIFHAAAYKHVPLMELYPEEAITNNVMGSYNLFKAADTNGVERVVVISTDKAVNPTNVMGATKRVVEMMAAQFNKDSKTDYCCVRFGNVIGSRGSMLPLFLEEIKAGRPITVTDRNIIRYFMAIPEAVGLVFRAATLAKGGEVMVLDMGQPVKIYDFAQKLIDIFGDGRSSIKITGLRPGEKLYEELLASKDNTIPTENEKIFKAKVSTALFTTEQMDTMIANIPNMTTGEMVEHLHHAVPEFKSSK